MEDLTKPDNMDTGQGTPQTPESESPQEDKTEDPNAESLEIIDRFAPGLDTSTPEAIIAAQLKVLQSMVPIYDKLYDVALAAPEAGQFVADLLETGDPVKALVRNYDTQEVQAALDSADSGDHEADMAIHSSKVESAKAHKMELEGNMKASEVSAQEFMDKYEPNDQDVAGFTAFYDTLLQDAVNNKMSVAHWESIWQAYKYKDDVSEAESNGKVMGRNEKIMTQKAGKKDMESLLPEANAGVQTPPPANTKPRSFASKFMEGI